MYDWSNEKLYIFPPFRLSGRVLKKIEMRSSSHNSSVYCFTSICPTLTPHDSKTHSTAGPAIYLPQDPGRPQPMRNLKFLACAVLSYSGRNREFLAKLEISPERVGERALKSNTTLTLRSGRISVTTETLIL